MKNIDEKKKENIIRVLQVFKESGAEHIHLNENEEEVYVCTEMTTGFQPYAKLYGLGELEQVMFDEYVTVEAVENCEDVYIPIDDVINFLEHLDLV